MASGGFPQDRAASLPALLVPGFLIGSIAIIPAIPTVVRSTPAAKTVAQQITVRIDGPKQGGSGIIVERQGNVYYILTNAHVLQKAGIYRIQTPDGNRYPVDSRYIRRMPGVDLAILPFISTSNYPVARLGNSQQISAGQRVYVAGWPRSGGASQQRRFINTEGLLTEASSKLPRGYALSYTNLVRIGMSGGPVLDNQGRVIGINGMVRLVGNSDTIVASGISIDTYLTWRSQLKLPTPVKTPQVAVSPTAVSAKTGTVFYKLANTLKVGTGSVSSVGIGTLAQGRSVQGLMAASGHSDGTISLWNLSTGKLIRTWRGHGGAVNAVVISPDGQRLVSGGDDRMIKTWNINTGKPLVTLTGHQDTVATLAFSADSKTLVSGSWDNTIKIWQLPKGQLLHTLTGHLGSVNSVEISPDGKTLVSGSQDTTIRLWNLTTGKLVRILKGHSRSVSSVAISLDGKILASGGGDGTIRLWNLNTGKLTRTLTGHTDGVWSVTMTRDGNTLISGSWDKTIKLWDMRSGQLKSTLNGHSGYVVAVALSQDGQTLVSGGWDQQIRIWRKQISN
ncbi:MAG: trypsin-like serine protease [Moorea sp. SIO4A3]|nr:trypsin-like serine protease [Moorena sp. SIO4A3]